MKKLLILSLFILAVPAWATHTCSTCYVDYMGGSDANSGASTVLAWQHLPGMTGATGNAASQVPVAGDRYILKGGVTWPATAFPMTWTWSGSTGNLIYIGVDATYYTGGSWARPIFNAGGGSTDWHNSYFAYFSGANYWQLDNIEWTGLFWSAAPSYGKANYIVAQSPTNFILSNNYAHGMTHSGCSGASCNNWDGTPNGFFVGSTSGGNTGASAYGNVIDNADGSADCCIAFFGGPPVQYQNVIAHLTNGSVVNLATSFHDNLIGPLNLSYDALVHQNCFEDNFDQGILVYNNVCKQIYNGLVMNISPQQTYTAYVFNNLLVNSPTTQLNMAVTQAPSTGTCCGTVNFYNNIVQAPASVACFNIEAATNSANLINNHCMTSGALYVPENGSSHPPIANTTNLLQTVAAANSAGYTLANLFQPIASNSPTVGAATNETSACGTASDLCLTTTQGVVYNTGNHTVSYPAMRTIARPASGTWDIGAYQYQSGITSSYSGAITMSGGVTIH